LSRWNPKLRTVDVVHPPKFFVPGSAETAPSSVEPRGKTWGIRVRGDTEGTVKHAYRCPIHGTFEAMVPRASVPDEVPCVVPAWFAPRRPGTVYSGNEVCEAPSPWAGSTCGIGHAAGEVMS
jgi:hypothetical protein